MIVADPKKLARITPGEVSRDQAIIDYFYWDPNVPPRLHIHDPSEFLAPLAKILQVGSTLYTLDTSRPVGVFSREESAPVKYVVSDIKLDPNDKHEVTLTLGAETINLPDRTRFEASVDYVLYNGIVDFIPDPANPAYDIIIMNHYAYKITGTEKVIATPVADGGITTGTLMAPNYVISGANIKEEALGVNLRINYSGTKPVGEHYFWLKITGARAQLRQY